MSQKEKKHFQRFTLSFDSQNPDMQKVIDKLNSLGERQKAVYVTKAVLCYMDVNKIEKEDIILHEDTSIDEEKKARVQGILKMFKA